MLPLLAPPAAMVSLLSWLSAVSILTPIRPRPLPVPSSSSDHLFPSTPSCRVPFWLTSSLVSPMPVPPRFPSKNYALWEVNIRFTRDLNVPAACAGPPSTAHRARGPVRLFFHRRKRVCSRAAAPFAAQRNWRLRVRMGVPRGRAKLIAVGTVNTIDRRRACGAAVYQPFAEKGIEDMPTVHWLLMRRGP